MRGRKKGSFNENGWPAKLAELEVGEHYYIDTTLEGYPAKMRQLNVAHTRRPAILKDRVFATNLFTAVSNSKAGDVRYLICIERKV